MSACRFTLLGFEMLQVMVFVVYSISISTEAFKDWIHIQTMQPCVIINFTEQTGSSLHFVSYTLIQSMCSFTPQEEVMALMRMRKMWMQEVTPEVPELPLHQIRPGNRATGKYDTGAKGIKPCPISLRISRYCLQFRFLLYCRNSGLFSKKHV